jgi:hypothetical protein
MLGLLRDAVGRVETELKKASDRQLNFIKRVNPNLYEVEKRTHGQIN